MTTLKDLFHSNLALIHNDDNGISDDPTCRHYLRDMIGDAAEMSIDLFDAPLYQFIGEHPDCAEEALEEFGYDGCGKSLLGIARMAEYIYYERKLYDILNPIITVLLLRGMFCSGINPEEDAAPYRGMIEDYAENTETCYRIVEIVDEFLNLLEESKAM